MLGTAYDVESNESSKPSLVNSVVGWFQRLSAPESYPASHSQIFTTEISPHESITIQGGKAILFEPAHANDVAFINAPSAESTKTFFDFSTCNNGFLQEHSVSIGNQQTYIQVDFNNPITEAQFNCIIDKVVNKRAIYKMHPEKHFSEKAKLAYKQFRAESEHQARLNTSSLAQSVLVGFGAGFSEIILRRCLHNHLKNHLYSEKQIQFLDWVISHASSLMFSYMTGSYFALVVKVIEATDTFLKSAGYDLKLVQEVAIILLALEKLYRGNITSVALGAGNISGASMAKLVLNYCNNNALKKYDIESDGGIEVESEKPSGQLFSFFASSDTLRKRPVESIQSAPAKVIEPEMRTSQNLSGISKNAWSTFFSSYCSPSPKQQNLGQRLQLGYSAV